MENKTGIAAVCGDVKILHTTDHSKLDMQCGHILLARGNQTRFTCKNYMGQDLEEKMYVTTVAQLVTIEVTNSPTIYSSNQLLNLQL